jgi:RNA polymerase sigma-70 factor, ECF subfamily
VPISNALQSKKSRTWHHSIGDSLRYVTKRTLGFREATPRPNVELETVMTLSSDQSLIARLRRGDNQAASEFYDRYVKRVFGLVHQQMSGRLHAVAQPEDIVQSVFKSIFRGLTTGDYDAPESGSLWRLMAIVAVNKVRQNARRRLAGKRDTRRTQYLVELESFEAKSSGTPEEFELAIREAIEGLKPFEQEVVVLRVQGFTVEDISNELNRSRRGIERALQKIRESLLQTLDACELADD